MIPKGDIAVFVKVIDLGMMSLVLRGFADHLGCSPLYQPSYIGIRRRTVRKREEHPNQIILAF